jgi:hypothetical protein
VEYFEINELIDTIKQNIQQYLDFASVEDLQDLIFETVETL